MIKENYKDITFTETKQVLVEEECRCDVCKKLIYKRELDPENTTDSRFPKYVKSKYIMNSYEVKTYLYEDDNYPNEEHACSDECLATLFLNWTEGVGKRNKGSIISVTSH